MHKVAMEMGKWAMEKAKTHGFDNLSAQDWDDLKDCMEAVKRSILDAWDMTDIVIPMADLPQRVEEVVWDINRTCTWKMMTGWTSI